MATYKQIQNYVKEIYHFTPKTCWIANVKEISGFLVKRAPNRIGIQRLNPCPKNRIDPIRVAFKYFKMIQQN